MLLAAGIYALTLGWRDRATTANLRRATITWVMGTGLGLGVAAVQILPLGFYLAKSPVWGDRLREQTPWWTIARPRLLDAVCTAVPYAYGSQRRGHPNLARAVGVHNLNESAGGFAGLATLIWLAPLAVVTRGRSPGSLIWRASWSSGQWPHFGCRRSTTCSAVYPSSTSPITAG